MGRASLYQEPITWSFHLPYLPSESTLSRIFLFLEASPTGFFAGVYIVANHKRAVVLYCLRYMQRRKAFAFGRQFFWGAMRTSACFRRKSKNHSRASYFIRSHITSRAHCLKKTSSMQSKRRDLHHTWLYRETNEERSFHCYSPRWITATFSTKLPALLSHRCNTTLSLETLLTPFIYYRWRFVRQCASEPGRRKPLATDYYVLSLGLPWKKPLSLNTFR